jgi:hypothetical protein
LGNGTCSAVPESLLAYQSRCREADDLVSSVAARMLDALEALKRATVDAGGTAAARLAANSDPSAAVPPDLESLLTTWKQLAPELDDFVGRVGEDFIVADRLQSLEADGNFPPEGFANASVTIEETTLQQVDTWFQTRSSATSDRKISSDDVSLDPPTATPDLMSLAALGRAPIYTNYGGWWIWDWDSGQPPSSGYWRQDDPIGPLGPTVRLRVEAGLGEPNVGDGDFVTWPDLDRPGWIVAVSKDNGFKYEIDPWGNAWQSLDPGRLDNMGFALLPADEAAKDDAIEAWNRAADSAGNLGSAWKDMMDAKGQPFAPLPPEDGGIDTEWWDEDWDVE